MANNLVLGDDRGVAVMDFARMTLTGNVICGNQFGILFASSQLSSTVANCILRNSGGPGTEVTIDRFSLQAAKIFIRGNCIKNGEAGISLEGNGSYAYEGNIDADPSSSIPTTGTMQAHPMTRPRKRLIRALTITFIASSLHRFIRSSDHLIISSALRFSAKNLTCPRIRGIILMGLGIRTGA